ncbi:MAG: hypothetical protein ABII68_09925 [Pseudomonadota bacterium]
MPSVGRHGFAVAECDPIAIVVSENIAGGCDRAGLPVYTKDNITRNNIPHIYPSCGRRYRCIKGQGLTVLFADQQKKLGYQAPSFFRVISPEYGPDKVHDPFPAGFPECRPVHNVHQPQLAENGKGALGLSRKQRREGDQGFAGYDAALPIWAACGPTNHFIPILLNKIAIQYGVFITLP